jgi:hypothetical protein
VAWEPLEEFPGYSVSEAGRVRNDDTGHLLALLRNQQGAIHVGIQKDREQYRRSVGLLVAKAFLDPPPFDTFNTPIHLDGDLSNNEASNLLWRPRWFAIKYHAQFHNTQRGFPGPIVEIHTQEQFPNSWEAAIQYGLIDRDIYVATINRTYVFPTYQEFREIT